jgi:hypothetical protein
MMRWDEISKRIPKQGNIIGVEVGVWQGENAAKLFEMNENLVLILVDQWANDNQYMLSGDGKSKLTELDFLRAMQITIKTVQKYGMHALIICESSLNAASILTQQLKLPVNILDFVFIDANHSYESVKNDIEIWYPLIKPGGFISGHDYGVYPGVSQAVNERFTNIELGDDYTWFAKKQ